MDYKEKYLKYKFKYLQLKESIEGGAPSKINVRIAIKNMNKAYTEYSEKVNDNTKRDLMNAIDTMIKVIDKDPQFVTTQIELITLEKAIDKNLAIGVIGVLKTNVDAAIKKSKTFTSSIKGFFGLKTIN